MKMKLGLFITTLILLLTAYVIADNWTNDYGNVADPLRLTQTLTQHFGLGYDFYYPKLHIAAAPPIAVEGGLWYDSTNHVWKFHNGTSQTALGTFSGTYSSGTVTLNTAGTYATNIGTNGNSGAVTIGNESAQTTVNGVVDINFVGDSQIRIDVCDITNAQIKSMFSTPINLVSAPGAHKMIVPVSLTLVHIYAGAQFDANTIAITPAWVYSSSDTNTACMSTVSVTNLLGTASANRCYTLIPIGAGGASTLTENCPIKLTLPTGAGQGNPTGTSATGTMRAVISYRIMPTGT
jgi:hypothetical protein